MRKGGFWTAVLFAVTMCVVGAAQTAPPKVVLVELFTSEGCSSCPPADALLKRLDGMRTETGQLIVGISEHVTYWNQLGWVDPFSQELFTQRQRDYSEAFRQDDVYTPQMVVNGEAQMVGSDGRAVQAALRTAGRAAEGNLRIGTVAADGKALNVSFATSGVASDAEIYAVIAEVATTSKVLRGENGGRTLEHVSVARTLVRVGKAGGGAQSAQVKLPAGLAQASGRRRLILFVQAGLGRVLAADVKEL